MQKYYKAYYMITARCNLSCSYCVLENAPHQLKQELTLLQKQELISHLYHQLDFRSLTISGGEALLIGRSAPNEFIQLLSFLRQYKSDKKEDNLLIKLYTNGLYLNEGVASAMRGIIDEISINIDSCDNDTLLLLGRNKTSNDNYFQRVIEVAKILYEKNIKIKLHTVVNSMNYNKIAEEVPYIYKTIKAANPLFNSWKIYQYMSYDVPEIDKKHFIDNFSFEQVKKDIQNSLKGEVRLHFKDNTEMNASLFNILATGIAQYMSPTDTWNTSKRTESLVIYHSMEELFCKNNIDPDLFNRYHTYIP